MTRSFYNKALTYIRYTYKLGNIPGEIVILIQRFPDDLYLDQKYVYVYIYKYILYI